MHALARSLTSFLSSAIVVDRLNNSEANMVSYLLKVNDFCSVAHQLTWLDLTSADFDPLSHLILVICKIVLGWFRSMSVKFNLTRTFGPKANFARWLNQFRRIWNRISWLLIRRSYATGFRICKNLVSMTVLWKIEWWLINHEYSLPVYLGILILYRSLRTWLKWW